MATAWQKKFGASAKRCFATGPTSAKAFGRCMKDALKGTKAKKKARRGRRK
jgi:hypothetical protein